MAIEGKKPVKTEELQATAAKRAKTRRKASWSPCTDITAVLIVGSVSGHARPAEGGPSEEKRIAPVVAGRTAGEV